MYTLKNLSSYYAKNKALNNISLGIYNNALISLIGSNGSGKTTLLRVLAGLQNYSGSALLNEREIKNYKRRDFSRLVSIMPSAKNFHPAYNFTAYEIISMSRLPFKNLFGKLNAHDENIIYSVSEMLDIKNLLHRNILTLSDGERQLILLASALAQNTNIIILDEPTSALDPDKAARVFKILRELAENKIIIAAVHDINISLAFSNYYIALKKGCLISHGLTQNLNAAVLEKLYNSRFENYFNNKGDVMWRAVPD